MTDETSPILDFYPSDFEIDMNGKKMQWQGVALLPFIDQDRLLTAMEDGYPKLTEDDIKRNTSGHDVLFVSDDHRLYDSFCKLYTKSKSSDVSLPFFSCSETSGLTLAFLNTSPSRSTRLYQAGSQDSS